MLLICIHTYIDIYIYIYIYIYIKSGLIKFLVSLVRDRLMNLKINILTKKGFTNLDIFLYYYKFQKITKTVLMVVAEEATEIFL